MLTKFLNSRQIAKILIPPFKNNYDIHSARGFIDRESCSLLGYVHVCIDMVGGPRGEGQEAMEDTKDLI